MAKRAHGEGSLTQLTSGNWRGRISIKGKRLSFTHEKKEKVAAWLRKTARQVQQGLTYEAARESVGIT